MIWPGKTRFLQLYAVFTSTITLNVIVNFFWEVQNISFQFKQAENLLKAEKNRL